MKKVSPEEVSNPNAEAEFEWRLNQELLVSARGLEKLMKLHQAIPTIVLTGLMGHKDSRCTVVMSFECLGTVRQLFYNLDFDPDADEEGRVINLAGIEIRVKEEPAPGQNSLTIIVP